MDAVCRGIEDCWYLESECRHMEDQVRRSGCPWRSREEDDIADIPSEVNFDD